LVKTSSTDVVRWWVPMSAIEAWALHDSLMCRVQGCSHSAFAQFINCDYMQIPSDNLHAQHVYAKEADADGVTASIYFWNGTEGYSDYIFAYHPASWETLPPAKGWQVPRDGPADPGMVVRWIDTEVLHSLQAQASPVEWGTPTPAKAGAWESKNKAQPEQRTCLVLPETQRRPAGRWDRYRQRKEVEAESGVDRSRPGVDSSDVLAQQQAAGGRPSVPCLKVRRGRETIDMCRPDQSMAAAVADWPELPPMQGESRHAGKPPRGAGIIAFLEGQSAGAMHLDHYVCIVQKAGGNTSFPKGGRKAAETLTNAAFREWQEECGIPDERLQLVHGFHVDEPMIGVRYLVAHCLPCANSSGPDPPTAGECAWKPPAEDLSENDPIVKARWVSVGRCVRGELSKVRRELLRQAFVAYSHSRQGRSLG